MAAVSFTVDVMFHPSSTKPWPSRPISRRPTSTCPGWSPKYFPPILVQYANTLLKDKVLFGTDFPMLTPDRWRADLDRTAIRDEIKPALYKHNAARPLGLRGLGVRASGRSPCAPGCPGRSGWP